MPRKDEPMGERNSAEYQAVKLGMAVELLGIYQSGGVEAVQHYLTKELVSEDRGKGRPEGLPRACSREEALSAIESSRGIVEDMGLR